MPVSAELFTTIWNEYTTVTKIAEFLGIQPHSVTHRAVLLRRKGYNLPPKHAVKGMGILKMTNPELFRKLWDQRRHRFTPEESAIVRARIRRRHKYTDADRAKGGKLRGTLAGVRRILGIVD